MSQKLVVRLATIEDAPIIARIELDSARYERRLQPLDFSQKQLSKIWKQRIESKEFRVLVACVATQVVAFIGCIVAARKTGFIQAIYVDPPFYHQGIGTILLHYSEKIMQDLQCPLVQLYVEPLNHNGQRFYLKAGYKQTDRFYCHLRIFEKELTSC